MPDHIKPRGKSLEQESLVPDFNDTKIQKYMSFVNFLVMPDKTTVFPYVDTSLTQFYYMNCRAIKSNYTSVIAALQTAKPPSYPQLLLPSTPITLQNRVTESCIPSTTEVQMISPKQEQEAVRDRLSIAISAIQNIMLGFLKTLSKTLQLNLCLSLVCKRIGLKLELKTQFKYD